MAGTVFDNDDLWDDVDDEELANLDVVDNAVESTTPEDSVKSLELVGPPLHQLRPGYLWVSDLCTQSWCEQKMVYTMTLPVEVVEKPEMTAGSDLHLARELAVQDVKKVKVTSSEDIWAVKVLNLLGAVNSFLAGTPIRREIPVFGAPFDKDVFMVGLVDEIQCDPETFTFDILELKTRSSSRIPSKTQQDTHRLQVMLYKKLYDDLIRGKVSPEDVARHLKLRLDHPLGDDVLKEMDSEEMESCKTLRKLMTFTFERLQSLPCISQCLIEYCYQEDKSTIAIHSIDYNETWLKTKFFDHVSFWEGQRDTKGVDIEEAWKCQSCDFADVCSWRRKKAEEYASKNAQKMSPVKVNM